MILAVFSDTVIYYKQQHTTKKLRIKSLCCCQFQNKTGWTFNTLRPRQNGRHFADDVFKCIFLNENVWILLKISLKFVPKGRINNIPSLVQIKATSHYLSQWWFDYRRIYASLGLIEFKNCLNFFRGLLSYFASLRQFSRLLAKHNMSPFSCCTLHVYAPVPCQIGRSIGPC